MSEFIEDNITEQRYLELCDDMKEIVNDKDKENKKLQNENDILKKTLYKIYGVANFLNDTLPDIDLIDGEQSALISIGYIIDSINKVILPNLVKPTIIEVYNNFV
jgi:hypothetical protein